MLPFDKNQLYNGLKGNSQVNFTLSPMNYVESDYFKVLDNKCRVINKIELRFFYYTVKVAGLIGVRIRSGRWWVSQDKLVGYDTPGNSRIEVVVKWEDLAGKDILDTFKEEQSALLRGFGAIFAPLFN